jgi:hypothetical protein
MVVKSSFVIFYRMNNIDVSIEIPFNGFISLSKVLLFINMKKDVHIL